MCACLSSRAASNSVDAIQTHSLADSDVRYDKDTSNALVDQAVVWARASGYYRRTGRAFGPTGQPFSPVPFDPARGLGLGPRPYSQNPAYGFFNITNDGSRRYEHRITINPPASLDFCSQEVPEGFLNVLPGGTCGETGFAAFIEVYSTSTYEKDGSARRIAAVSSVVRNFTLSGDPGIFVPV